jgi:hypothetical protein
MNEFEKWFVRLWAIAFVIFSAWAVYAMSLSEVVSDPTFPEADKMAAMESTPPLQLYLIMGFLQLGLFLSTTGLAKSMRASIVIGMVPAATLLVISLFGVLAGVAKISGVGLAVLIPILVVSILLYASAFLRMRRIQ